MCVCGKQRGTIRWKGSCRSCELLLILCKQGNVTHSSCSCSRLPRASTVPLSWFSSIFLRSVASCNMRVWNMRVKCVYNMCPFLQIKIVWLCLCICVFMTRDDKNLLYINDLRRWQTTKSINRVKAAHASATSNLCTQKGLRHLGTSSSWLYWTHR